MTLRDLKTKDDVLKYVEEHISNSYAEIWFENASDLANSYLIKYEDLARFKIVQKYLRHSELILAKSLINYLFQIFEENGYKCSLNKYNTLYIKSKKLYVHLFDYDKFMSLNCFEDGKAGNVYVVFARDSETVLSKINWFNSKLSKSSFMTLKSFVCKYLNNNTWNKYFDGLFDKLSRIINNNKMIEVANIYSEPKFKSQCLIYLSDFDYKTELDHICKYDFNEFNAINEIFKERKNILIEDYEFSISYMTSEWLFQNQLSDNNLDKTFIVSGYLKSLEQLLFYFVKTTGKSLSVRLDNGFKWVSPHDEGYAKCTLGNLKYLLSHNKDCFENFMDILSIEQINKLFADWIDEGRNEYFHKDNIYRLEDVSNIRNKTYLLYFLLLGSLNNEKKEIVILDERNESKRDIIFVGENIGSTLNLKGSLRNPVGNISKGSISNKILVANGLSANNSLVGKLFTVKLINKNPQGTGWILDIVKVLDN